MARLPSSAASKGAAQQALSAVSHLVDPAGVFPLRLRLRLVSGLDITKPRIPVPLLRIQVTPQNNLC